MNALVFAGVLLVVLAAVEVTRRWRTPPLPVLVRRCSPAACCSPALLPPGLLLGLPVRAARRSPRSRSRSLPIFVANLIFAKRFADTADATSAFGANLLGAMVGGCLEYLSLIVGYQALLLLAALLYGLALCDRPALPRRIGRGRCPGAGVRRHLTDIACPYARVTLEGPGRGGAPWTAATRC